MVVEGGSDRGATEINVVVDPSGGKLDPPVRRQIDDRHRANGDAIRIEAAVDPASHGIDPSTCL